MGKELTKHNLQPFYINFFFLKMDVVIWYRQWGEIMYPYRLIFQMFGAKPFKFHYLECDPFQTILNTSLLREKASDQCLIANNPFRSLLHYPEAHISHRGSYEQGLSRQCPVASTSDQNWHPLDSYHVLDPTLSIKCAYSFNFPNIPGR